MGEKKNGIGELLWGRLKEPLKKKDLPKFPGWAAVFGPGMIWAAMAQGSGELIWWPYMVAKYGTFFLGWLFIFASLQYWVNLEIARYTVATGESTYEGFHRVNRLIAWIILIFVLVATAWVAGLAGAGATAIAELTKFPTGWSPKMRTIFWAELAVWLIWILIMVGPVAYRVVEVIATLSGIASFFGMLSVVIAVPAVHAILGEYLTALFTPRLGLPPTWDPADAGKLVTMIAYTGAGGFWNLLYTYWVRDEGAGMAKHIGRVTSPVTGKPEPIPEVGYGFEMTPEAEKEWKKWVRWIWVDDAFGVILNALTIVFTTMLSLAILHPQGLTPTGWKLCVVQAEWFAALWGDAGRVAMLLLAFFFLIDCYLEAYDGVCRAIASNLQSNIPATRKWHYRDIYYLMFTIYTIIASIEFFLAPPAALVVSSGIANMLNMAIYCVVLLYLNWFHLPKIHPAGEKIRPSWIPFIFLLISTVVFWYTLIGLYLPTLL
ncbi:hypothetical protein DRO02_06285 [archaeon]|nr:MAG: hypothetical protein DRO02_06285 [archaeon]